MDWTPLILTFQVALSTTLILLVVGLPLAYWLAYSRSKFVPLVETLVTMPLVLPPTVLGFYLLLLLSPDRGLGLWLYETIGVQLVFSFAGLVLASVVYSLPFMVQPIQSGLQNLNQDIREASFLLGKSRWQTLKSIELPNIRPALITAIVLSFAHTIGEFGVVLMIGGNIPGVSKVASIAIYESVESLDYAQAHFYSGVLFAICFAILLMLNLLQRRYKMNSWW